MILWMLIAEATCGLDACPPTAAPRGEPVERARIGGATTYTSAADGAGWYVQNQLAAQVRVGPVVAGARTGQVVVQDGFGRASSWANTMGFVEVALAPPVSVGLQVEAPTSSREADNGHWAALPYVHTKLQSGQLDVQLRAGGIVALDRSGHEHQILTYGPRVQVDPHTRAELRVRPEVGWMFVTGPHWVRTFAGTELILPLSGGVAGQAHVGATLGTGRIRVRGETTMGVGKTRRFAQRAMLSVAIAWLKRSS